MESKNLIIIILIVALLGAAIYLYYTNSTTKAVSKPTETSNGEEQKTLTDAELITYKSYCFENDYPMPSGNKVPLSSYFNFAHWASENGLIAGETY